MFHRGVTAGAYTATGLQCGARASGGHKTTPPNRSPSSPKNDRSWQPRFPSFIAGIRFSKIAPCRPLWREITTAKRTPWLTALKRPFRVDDSSLRSEGGESAGFALAGLPAEDADSVGEIGATAAATVRVGATVAVSRGIRRGGFFEGCAFAGGEEEIGLDGVLFGVEVVIPATKRIEACVRATLDDAAGFHDKDLIGSADGREAVRDDKRGAAAHEVAQAFLN